MTKELKTLGKVVGVIVLIVLAAVLYGFGKSFTPSAEEAVGDAEVATSSAEEISEEMMLYKNEKFGFEFYYPQSFSMHERNNFLVQEEDSLRVVVEKTLDLNGSEAISELFVVTVDTALPPVEGFCSEIGHQKSVVTIDEVRALKCVGSTPFGDAFVGFAMQHNGINYHIGSGIYTHDNKSTVDAIVSSFKFTR